MTWDDISLDALFDRSLELTVWDHDRLSHNEILGGVRFNLGTGKLIPQSIITFCLAGWLVNSCSTTYVGD